MKFLILVYPQSKNSNQARAKESSKNLKKMKVIENKMIKRSTKSLSLPYMREMKTNIIL